RGAARSHVARGALREEPTARGRADARPGALPRGGERRAQARAPAARGSRAPRPRAARRGERRARAPRGRPASAARRGRGAVTRARVRGIPGAPHVTRPSLPLLRAILPRLLLSI